MADDGSGSDISIPSILMFKRDADMVKDELTANRPVQLEMTWSLPDTDDRVEYDLWTTPVDSFSRNFLHGFKTVAEALGDRAYFTPHMYIHDGIRSHCQGNSGENFCYNLCTNNGRYCTTDPEKKGISGADVVRESLRRLCIWNMYGAANGIGKEWWEYVAEFEVHCSNPDYFADDACIQDVYKNAKVDGVAIERCMVDSGGTANDRTNSKLDYELSAQEQRGIVVTPMVSVNGFPMRSALTVKNVLKTICSAYAYSSVPAPAVCGICADSDDPVACVEAKKQEKDTTSDGKKPRKLHPLLLVFGITILAAGLGAVIYKLYVKRAQDVTGTARRGLLTALLQEEEGPEQDTMLQ